MVIGMKYYKCLEVLIAPGFLHYISRLYQAMPRLRGEKIPGWQYCVCHIPHQKTKSSLADITRPCNLGRKVETTSSTETPLSCFSVFAFGNRQLLPY